MTISILKAKCLPIQKLHARRCKQHTFLSVIAIILLHTVGTVGKYSVDNWCVNTACFDGKNVVFVKFH